MDYNIEEGIFYIFTDGASRSVFNHKLGRKTGRHGGKGVRSVYYDKKGNLIEKDESDNISYTKATNQDMELGASIDAVKLAYEKDISNFRKLVIVTDSMFICDNRKNAYYGNREWKSWKTIYGDPIVHKKERKELAKYMRKMPIRIEFDRVKGHKDNKYNNKADKSAVAGAQSKTRIVGNNSEVRKKFFKQTIWFKKGYIPIQGQEILIHIYSSRYLRKGGLRYNYEVVSWDNGFFRNASRLFYNQEVLSAEFIYLVKIKSDGSNQIEEIISTHTKDEIRDKMISEGFDPNIFFGKTK